MPSYEYSCDKCKVTTTEYRFMEHRDDAMLCQCGAPMRRLISSGVSGKVEHEYYHPAFNEIVKNKRHYRELQRKHKTRDMEGADWTKFQERMKQGTKPKHRPTTDAEYQEAANKYGLRNN